MPLDFRNPNALWASVLVETLQRLGLATAAISPGSRSTPLTVAFAQHDQIDAIPILDERSASFFALGRACASQTPVALVCTSGTAGANYYPAVIEARESRVPLLILTADRPPELRDCHAGQAIDQVKLFGHYPNWQAELSLPELSLAQLAYLRQTLVHAWARSQAPVPGPVHLNIPFRDPLAPVTQPEAAAMRSQINEQTFFAAVRPQLRPGALGLSRDALPLAEWMGCDRGLIIAGPAQPADPETYCRAIAHLSSALGWPVLAEALSPLRNYASLNPALISTYDFIVREPSLANALAPEMVIQVGPLPTAKELRHWLQETAPLRWIIDPCDRNLDPLHGPTHHLCCSVESLALAMEAEPRMPSPYCKQWLIAETQARQALDSKLTQMEQLFEGKVAWSLPQYLPAGTPLFIANSMPVRDAEWFWPPNDRQIQPYFNRGANGIDGTLSSALGMAHGNQASVLLTGDLALLHDTNGFLLRHHCRGHLTILLINNNGGGIFQMLPIAQFEPPFEAFFATPQHIDFAQLCQTYDIDYERIRSWSQLQQRLNHLPKEGIRILEVPTDRRVDSQMRHKLSNWIIEQLQKDSFE